MKDQKKRNPLLVEEDWWAVWFGSLILLVATVLGILTLSDSISAKSVPKLGKWSSNPLDVFYLAKKNKISLKDDATLKELAVRINAKDAKATAQIIQVDGGIRLRVSSLRNGDRKTISLTTLLDGGEIKLYFTQETPDSAGKGARAYISQTLPSADVVIGKGKLTITTERSRLIALPLLVTMICIILLTSIGVWSMRQNARRYALACVAIFFLSIIAFASANNHIMHSYGLSYAAWALAIGLLISNTIGMPKWIKPAVRTEMYVKTGLVLLGAEILFGKILSVGIPGLMVAWVVTPIVIIFMWLFGTRILKMVSKPLVIIIAAATSVCGATSEFSNGWPRSWATRNSD
jgi:hypothetical protein